ncbi:MAG: recombinase family protein, partial [Acidimicrobiia bacterium]
MGTPKAAAVYVRVSRDSQGQGLGIERQQELCKRLAKEKGWPVAETYVDNDISAYSGKPRPGYEKMLADIESGARDAVLVVDQDRLVRRMKELVPFMELADSLGIPLANVQGDTDLSNTDGRFKAHIMGAVAEQESSRKSDRVKRQKEGAAAKGWWQGGRRPYGYQPKRTDDGFSSLEIIPQEAEIVKELAQRILAGASLRTLATELNERGVPTAGGKQWRVTTIANTMTGASIAAMRVHNGKIAGQANWEPILDRSTWEQVRAVLKGRSKTSQGRPAGHLLTGLLECGKCGGTLYYRKGHYVCQRQPERPNCGGTSIH